MRERPNTFAITLLLALTCCSRASAHDAPVRLPEPRSAGEAWNVIEQSAANVDQLLAANLMRDIGGQLANVSVALRFLSSDANDKGAADVAKLTGALLAGEVGLLQSSRDESNAVGKTKPAWKDWRASLKQLEALYPADLVKSDVYTCPMHPLDRHLKGDERCSLCGMALLRRRLPASAVYQKPGEATLKATVTCEPLVVGRRAEVTLHLAKTGGSPVLAADLIELHTRKIHLLINDGSLGDYHHEHPTTGAVAGDYAFAFTPTKPGPYRVWADVTPAASGVQEYVIADLPGATTSQGIADRETRLSTTVDGRRYDLAIGSGEPIRAGQTYVGTVAVTGADGTPFAELEPVMGAFAHLVGFSEDGKSVLHIHPAGKEPTSPADRAGPAFAFKFYAPAAGFLRLYCQVHIGGADVFVPFNLTVAP